MRPALQGCGRTPGGRLCGPRRIRRTGRDERVQQREERYRQIKRWVAAAYAVVALLSLGLHLRTGDIYAALQALLGLAMLPLPALAGKLFGIRFSQSARVLYHLFNLGTILIGSSFYGYAKIPYWDKAFHFLSGFLITAAGLGVFLLLNPQEEGAGPTRRGFGFFFALLFNLSAAVVWEIYEYLLLILFGIDAVNTGTTGVHDTMQDMMVCAVGGLLYLAWLRGRLRRGKGDFLRHAVLDTLRLNGRLKGGEDDG